VRPLEGTVSVVWWPVVSSRAMTVEIRRRGLSDGFLSAFE
jgi:hypothetical protein